MFFNLRFNSTFCLILSSVRRAVVCTRGRPPASSVVQLTSRPIATVSFQCILADVQVSAPVTIPTATTVVKLAGLKKKTYQIFPSLERLCSKLCSVK